MARHEGGYSEGFLGRYLPYLIRQADQALSAPFYAVLTRSGVARSEWRVLAVLQELGELSVAELAAAALSPQPTVTHALRRLEQRGLVTRTVSTVDRRQRLATITPAGSTLTATLITEATRLEAEALAGAGDLSELVARLQELTALVESRSGVPADGEVLTA
ncbi:MAG: MarR family transcriptional regulator [Actinobacteria bacterium]|nr:MarR family transcriptional regulator [Actinomycetota bacterium]